MNSLQNLMDTVIMPAALPVLREACVMPMLVATNFNAEAAEQNQTIRVPLPQDLGVADDFSTAAGSSSTDLADPKVDITLDKWKYKQFEMNDKEMRETMTSGVLPSAADAAIKSIANAIDVDLLNLYQDIPYVYGVPGITADSVEDVAGVREVLQNNLCPIGDRRLVLNTATETKFLVAQKDVDKSGTTAALREASMGRLFGFDSFADQLSPKHVVGAAAADTLAVNGGYAAGATVVSIDGATGTNGLNKGDIITFAGVAGTYVVTAAVAAVVGAMGVVSIYPKLAEAVADNAAVTVAKPTAGNSHGVNLAFHRNAFMWAARTLTNENSENSTISVATDPVTGIPLRLETWRDPKFAKRFWRFDVLYGVKTIRAEFAARLQGKGAAG